MYTFLYANKFSGNVKFTTQCTENIFTREN